MVYVKAAVRVATKVAPKVASTDATAERWADEKVACLDERSAHRTVGARAHRLAGKTGVTTGAIMVARSAARKVS